VGLCVNVKVYGLGVIPYSRVLFQDVMTCCQCYESMVFKRCPLSYSARLKGIEAVSQRSAAAWRNQRVRSFYHSGMGLQLRFRVDVDR
jgi:hypothetical protein